MGFEIWLLVIGMVLMTAVSARLAFLYENKATAVRVFFLVVLLSFVFLYGTLVFVSRNIGSDAWIGERSARALVNWHANDLAEEIEEILDDQLAISPEFRVHFDEESRGILQEVNDMKESVKGIDFAYFWRSSEADEAEQLASNIRTIVRNWPESHEVTKSDLPVILDDIEQIRAQAQEAERLFWIIDNGDPRD